MVDQLLGCWVPTSNKMGRKSTNSVAKSHQDVAPNPPKWKCWGASCVGLWGSWRVLGGSWGHLGPKMVPRAKKTSKKYFWAPPWVPSWRPKSTKIAPKSDPKGDDFFDHFLNQLLKRFCANLVPTWPPKLSQNGAKLGPKSIQVGMLI